jgi:hypothetical protein
VLGIQPKVIPKARERFTKFQIVEKASIIIALWRDWWKKNSEFGADFFEQMKSRAEVVGEKEFRM